MPSSPGLAPHLLDLGGRQGEVAARGTVALEPGDADALEPGPQLLVAREQVGVDAGGGVGPPAVDLGQLGVDRSISASTSAAVSLIASSSSAVARGRRARRAASSSGSASTIRSSTWSSRWRGGGRGLSISSCMRLELPGVRRRAAVHRLVDGGRLLGDERDLVLERLLRSRQLVALLAGPARARRRAPTASSWRAPSSARSGRWSRRWRSTSAAVSSSWTARRPARSSLMCGDERTRRPSARRPPSVADVGRRRPGGDVVGVGTAVVRCASVPGVVVASSRRRRSSVVGRRSVPAARRRGASASSRSPSRRSAAAAVGSARARGSSRARCPSAPRSCTGRRSAPGTTRPSREMPPTLRIGTWLPERAHPHRGGVLRREPDEPGVVGRWAVPVLPAVGWRRRPGPGCRCRPARSPPASR